ncbi:MAG: hypothetical protein DMG08_28490 [Acidobacteria bacterium]|nr:MAG: hypothetical protein DMG08_28490 [Acidobacteriota bacterium]
MTDCVVAQSLGEQLREPVKPTLLMLRGAVVFVLLIACAKVANLLLGPAAGRHGEMAVRVALGALSCDAIRLVLWQGMRIPAVGIALGAAGGLALARDL